jgi:hypothetical protein
VSGSNIIAGTDKEVFLSSNNGTTWTAVNSGIGSLLSTQVYSLAVIGGNIFAGTASLPGGGIFLSTDSAKSWMAENSGLPTYTQVSSFTLSDTNIFVGTAYVSVNGKIGPSGVFQFIRHQNDTIWSYDTVRSYDSASASGTVYSVKRTVYHVDNGSWIEVSSGLKDTNVNCLAVSGSNIFAGTHGGVFLSINNGTSWTGVNSGLSYTNIVSLVVSGSKIFAGTYGGGVFLSIDSGTNWKAVNSGLNDTSGNISSLVISGSKIFAGTNHGLALSTSGTIGTSGGVFFSINNGASWTKVDTGLAGKGIYSLAVSDSNVFAGTYGGGVWRRPLSEFTPSTNDKQQILSQQSTVFNLTASTKSNHAVAISFSIAKSQSVTLKIYSLSGREIATLVNKIFGAGEHSLLWDTKGVAAGCYGAKMKVGSSVIVKNILLSW